MGIICGLKSKAKSIVWKTLHAFEGVGGPPRLMWRPMRMSSEESISKANLKGKKQTESYADQPRSEPESTI